MNLSVFNLALAIGWLLVIIGGCLINLGGGLAFGGLLLILITLVVARLGGLYAPGAKAKDRTDVPQ